MSITLSNNLSPKASEVITRLANSNDSQSKAIAEFLNDVASNGEGQEADEFLLTCAGELVKAASAVVATLSPPKTYNAEKDGEQFAKTFSNFLNNFSMKPQEVAVEKMLREHRSLQQTMMRFFMLFVAGMAKNSSDGRNEAAVNLAKEIMGLPERTRNLPKI